MKADVRTPSGWRLILNQRDEGDWQIGLVDPTGVGRFSIVKATSEEAIGEAEVWLVRADWPIIAVVLGGLARRELLDS